MPTLTIFTPAYNRAHTIGRTYESLCRQTCKDFLWLIIDDGSKDLTFEKALEMKPALEKRCVRVHIEKHENIGTVLKWR